MAELKRKIDMYLVEWKNVNDNIELDKNVNLGIGQFVRLLKKYTKITVNYISSLFNLV